MQDLSWLLDYTFDPEYAQELVSQYKDLIWLVVSLLSTLVVIYGIILPQRNGARHRKLEATLNMIERWTAQGFAQSLLEYQHQVALQKASNIHSENKTRLCSFFHTVALLIREKKIEESLIRKSQIGVGFVCFYVALSLEQPNMLEKQAFYGPTFRTLHKRWKGLVKLPKGKPSQEFPQEFLQLFSGLPQVEASNKKESHLRIVR